MDKENKFTLLGLTGVLIWGSGTFFERSLMEAFGNFSTSGLSNLLGGLISTGVQIKSTGLKSYGKAPLRYWLICGPLYIIYRLSTSIAVGISATREQVVTSGLIRLMWPLITLVLTVLMFRKENKASKWFPLGVIMSILGILVANTDAADFSLLSTLKVMFVEAFWPSLLSVISCASWGLYSNLNRKIVGQENYDAVGLFMIVTGVISFVVTLFIQEPQQFASQQMVEVIYMVIFSSFLATMFWNMSMQKGNHILVIFAANFLPVISTILNALFLGVELTVPMILGSVLVVAGTIWCRKCVQEVPSEATA